MWCPMWANQATVKASMATYILNLILRIKNINYNIGKN